jgi:hypothetical protein
MTPRRPGLLLLGVAISSAWACLGTPEVGAPPAEPVAAEPVAAEPSAAPAFPRHPTWTKLSHEEVDAWVTPHLKVGQELAHAAFQGPLGPTSDVVVVVTREGATFAGLLLVPEGSGARPVPLPELDAWSAQRVPAILFQDVDGDGLTEAILLLTYMTGVGPSAAEEFHANAVLAWDGARVTRLAAVEARIGALETAKDIRTALAR